MNTKLIKRDGSLANFDSSKIAIALNKAFKATGEQLKNGDSEFLMAEEIANKISSMETVPIEEIQNLAEKELMSKGYYETAKAYILYRKERTAQREKNTHLMTNLRSMFEFEKNANNRRENANIDGNTAMGSMLKFGSETAKEYVKMFVMRPEHSKSHSDGDTHVHDMDFLSIGTTTCTQIDLDNLFKNGFNTGHGYLRTPANIGTASQLTCIAIQSNQNEQHGGQSIPNFDRFMAPYVAKSYVKCLVSVLRHTCSDKETVSKIRDILKPYAKERKKILDEEGQAYVRRVFADFHFLAKTVDEVLKMALEDTEEAVYQAMEALVHNLNTLHSRAGAQVPFSSLNYGTDVSEEGRMVVKNLLNATYAGLGNGETPIFPIQIFRCKHGINFDEGDPNYDLFQLACKVSAKRLFPNFSFQDAPFNLQYYNPDDPKTEIAYMGCRTRVIANVNGPETTYSRGNLSFTSINLPRLGILAKGDWNEFYRLLDERLQLVSDQLLDRFEVQGSKLAKNFPFLMSQGNWIGGEKLNPEDNVREILKNGTLSIGFIGLAECLVAMMGVHHGESEEAQKKGLEIVGHIREYADKMTEKTHLNFSCLATPAEGLSGRFVKIDRERFGKIKGVTDREYYTNSFHVPVYYKENFYHKLKVEGPYHALTNGGHISYVEVSGDPEKNPKAFEQIVRCMDECGIGYGAINHPIDRDPVCGYSGIIEGDICPHCGRDSSKESEPPFERIRRITGYLVGTLDRFNDAKRAEVEDRVKHD